MKKLIITSKLALGDHLVLEMAIRSLHIQYPKEYITAVDVPQPEIFNHNPFISKAKTGDVIQMHYPLVNKSNQIAHSFADGYCDYLGQQLKIPLKLQVNKPNIYLTDKEKNKHKDLGKYWIVVCGGKNDFTAKHLPQGHLQEVVNHFAGRITFLQPIKKEHSHYLLKNVRVVSNINIRDLFSLIYCSEGVICPVTAHHHIAGALEKTCICVGGGREPVSWVMQYTKQHYLSSIGSLSCCAEKACWKSRVIKLDDGDKQEGSLCEKPIFYQEQWVPTCLARIKPTEIISILERVI